MLVERHRFPDGVVADLRAQVATRHSSPGLVDREAVVVREAFGDLCRDVEIGAQIVGRRTLCQLDQPSRITHEHRLIGG
ncbi:hypothetical protein D3C83_38310 [compost metagenome]